MYVAQGDPNQNWPFLRAITLKQGRSIFRKIVNKQLKIINKFLKMEKTTASQTYFGITDIGSETLSFRFIAHRKGQF